MGGFLDPLPVKNIVAVEESADRIGDTLLHGHHDLDNRLSFVETAQQKPGRIAEEEVSSCIISKLLTLLPFLCRLIFYRKGGHSCPNYQRGMAFLIVSAQSKARW